MMRYSEVTYWYGDVVLVSWFVPADTVALVMSYITIEPGNRASCVDTPIEINILN